MQLDTTDTKFHHPTLLVSNEFNSSSKSNLYYRRLTAQTKSIRIKFVRIIFDVWRLGLTLFFVHVTQLYRTVRVDTECKLSLHVGGVETENGKKWVSTVLNFQDFSSIPSRATLDLITL